VTPAEIPADAAYGGLVSGLKDRRRWLYLLLAAGAVVALDQATKAVILETVPLYHSISVIDGFFSITHIRNTGGAFGLFAGRGEAARLVFYVLPPLAAVLVLGFYFTLPWNARLLRFGFALVFGGAVGNIIDRFRFGEVVDFLLFYVGKWYWPAFNAADSAITVGIAVFLLHLATGSLPE
jgi:signal peptidase II